MRTCTVLVPAILCACLAAGVPAARAADVAASELRPALLVIDVQNVWLPRMSEQDRSQAPDEINKAVSLFREFGYPVVFVYHSDEQRGPAVGTEPFEFAPTVAVGEDDLRIVKAEPSAFTRTELERLLLERDCNLVFISGLSATGCVLATYYGAMEREFKVVLVKDALLSSNSSHTDMIEEICYSMANDDIRKMFEEMAD